MAQTTETVGKQQSKATAEECTLSKVARSAFLGAQREQRDERVPALPSAKHFDLDDVTSTTWTTSRAILSQGVS